ncbi:MAG: DNA polymerase III subunit gamma/tau, partial [Campylobacterales bacterium]|nr:DNA polymerase III subunit gamma/tau [Campylobacterales bacterium]
KQVLALKYRPRKFSDLIGQDTISTTLCLALDTNRLSHAYLFSGLRGSGKTSTARIMAKALVCQNAPTSVPCEECQGCKSANSYRHLDIIEMDAASNRGIDDIKELIEHTKYKPTMAKYKVFIIDEVHMLTTQAFNALLKTLEEPPEFVKFILATTDPLKLPATILSRTQHFRFKRISDQNIIHHLSHILNMENIQFEPQALEILTRCGQGSLRDTLTLLDQAIIFSKNIITTSSVTDMLGMIDPSFLENIFSAIFAKKDIRPIVQSLETYEVGQVIDEFSMFLKNKMLSQDSKFPLHIYDRFFRIFADSKQLLSLNSDSGFVLILMLSKMVEAVELRTIDQVIADVKSMDLKNEKPVAVKKESMQASQIKEDETQINQTNIPNTPYEVVIEPLNKINSDENIIDYEDMFLKVVENIYEKSYEIGSCFENSFSFDSFSQNTLHLNSTAKGDCKQILYKNFKFIREFIEDVYGENTEIEFNKIEKEHTKELARSVQPMIIEKIQSNDTGSMIEDIELNQYNQSSSCVGSLCDSSNPTLAQVELTVEDILNSKMTYTAIELFQPRNPPRIKNKV